MATLTAINMQRYARSLLLIGQKGQTLLFKARVLCVGAGGLGAPVLQYLAAAGVGTLGIVDGDKVEISNLQRQVIFTPDDIGKNKAIQAKYYLERFNPALKIIAYSYFIREYNIKETVNNFEVIIDCTDDSRTCYLLNNACVQYKKPLIFAGIHQFYGQCSVFNYQGGPCYCCLYESKLKEERFFNCTSSGVLGILPGILGCIQATETIKILLRKEKILSGRLLTINILSMRIKKFFISKNPQCSCCTKDRLSRKFSNKSFVKVRDENNKAPIREIKATTLFQQLRKSNINILLIDVRESYERDICHIGGLHIPLHTLHTFLKTLPKNKTIVLYCKSGQRSFDAAQILQDNGFKKVFSLQGGLLSWIKSIDSTLTCY
ncbi:HesA/MoeB/ThiF family protein [Coxiella endosymbiont of Amblyomma americanum]|uniref:HesA/MoeB/ThiF family protein n=1 Tax=Coxiella endosymbiont of Amblyomma americanum TaxID=325775 RepID=UPI00057F603E|nr:HesA/MoeB/ThiF family protein [Coxiella endosymbiont of Amblyomma americanum]AJC50187.1 thiamine biosynthesis protein ThiF [Coxiella endosymbiont of Amblyomma americanum]AUJ58548.1 thiamine biosynthesis protein ThiF [Coxiella-like endosymbiont of Amblyomma americanum]